MRYRQLDSRFWIDGGVRILDLTEKLLALYCLTAQTNRIGLFHFSPGRAHEDLELAVELFEPKFAKVIETLGWKYDEQARVLFIPTWFKYNSPANSNHL